MAQVNLFIRIRSVIISRDEISVRFQRGGKRNKNSIESTTFHFPLRHELLILLTSRDANCCENHKIFFVCFFGNCSTIA